MLSNEYLLSVIAVRKIYMDCCFVVTHLVHDGINFVNCVSKISKQVYLIPKGSGTNIGMAKLASNVTLLKTSKNAFFLGEIGLLEALQTIIKNKKFVIFDMGGYFTKLICEKLIPTSNLSCVIEDTENGHQKYLKAIKRSDPRNFPIYSVARSPLKSPEDYLVGQAIVFSAEKYLRNKNELLACKKALVIGYGKIGSSIAYTLRARGVMVYVCDTDYLKIVIAQAQSFRTVQKNEIINQVDLIFSATGNCALTLKDFEKNKRTCYVFTATSSDDEFCTQLSRQLNCQNKALLRYEKRIRNAVFPNLGNPINFKDGAVVGGFIQLVQAEMIHISRFYKRLNFYEGISELSNSRRRYIAKKWVERYHE